MRKMLFFEGWKVVIYENRIYLYIFWVGWVAGDGVYDGKNSTLEWNMQGDISLDVVLLYAE